MGRGEHAGHVLAKVCAPNTKAAWQTGSIPTRFAGRRHAAGGRVSFGWPLGRFSRPGFLPFLLPAREVRGDNTPS